MRLLVDAQCVQSTSSLRGIGRYNLSLLRALVENADEHRVEVLLNGGDDADRLLRARSAIETFLSPRRIHVFDAPWPWQLGEQHRRSAEAAYAAAVESLRPDAVLVGSVFEGDGENVLSLKDGGPPTAALLYDLIPAADPGTYLLGPGAEHYWRRFAQLKHADLLLPISDYSAAQARALMGGDCPPLATVWGGPYPGGDFPAFEQQGEEQPDLVLPERFVLSVGGDHPRKNLDRLVLAWGRVPAAHRARTSLVVACGLNTGTVRRLRRLARRAGLLPGQMVLTGRVSEQRLITLYRTALGFAFPSMEEGLGMPPIEAMAAGCPTVLARSSSLVELADDPQAFFDGESVEDIALTLTRLVADEAYREHLCTVAARSAERLTWVHAAQRAWQALEQLPTRTAAVLVSEKPVRLSRMPDEPQLRVSLAGAPAVVAPVEVCSALLAGGVVDLPLLIEDESATRASHDLLAALAPRVPALSLDDGQATALVTAVARAPRWSLQRPRPVWLLLSQRHDLREELRGLADERGADFVFAGPEGAALARSVDLVAVEAGLIDPAILTAARCRGTVVVVLDGEAPAWCRQGSTADGWPALLDDWVEPGRTTGWPWRG